MCNKTTRMFGFLKRNCREFNDSTCRKTVYCSFIRSLVEYVSIIWSTYQSGLVTKIEMIEKCFLNMMPIKLGKINTPSIELAKQLNLQSLADKRFKNDIFFHYKLLNNIIVCPELLEKNSINVPTHTLRSTNTFYVQPKKTKL